MLPSTLKDLTLYPARVARAYIEGNRVRYYGPVGYFFLMVTVFVLLLGVLGLDYTELMRTVQESVPGQGRNLEIEELARNYIAENLRWALFLSIPFQALAARFIFFRRMDYRYLEHAVLPIYLRGHLLWLSITNALLRSISGFWMPNVIVVFDVLYFGFGYISFQKDSSRLKSFMKGMGVFVLGQLFFLVALSIVVVVVLVLLRRFDPQFFEMIKPSHQAGSLP